jgi:hypothetical protein
VGEGRLVVVLGGGLRACTPTRVACGLWKGPAPAALPTPAAPAPAAAQRPLPHPHPQVEPFVCYFLLAAQLSVYALGTWVGATQVGAACRGAPPARAGAFGSDRDSSSASARLRAASSRLNPWLEKTDSRPNLWPLRRPYDRASRRPRRWRSSSRCAPRRCSRRRPTASGGASAAACCCIREQLCWGLGGATAVVAGTGASPLPALVHASSRLAVPSLCPPALLRPTHPAACPTSCSPPLGCPTSDPTPRRCWCGAVRRGAGPGATGARRRPPILPPWPPVRTSLALHPLRPNLQPPTPPPNPPRATHPSCPSTSSRASPRRPPACCSAPMSRLRARRAR